MLKKKFNFIIILFMLLFFLVMGVVCAQENNISINNDLSDNVISDTNNNITFSSKDEIKSTDELNFIQASNPINDKMKGILNYNDLQKLINENNTIDLDDNVIRHYTDKGKISINKNLVLDGHGHSIDGCVNGEAKRDLFIIKEPGIKVTLKNLIIKHIGTEYDCREYGSILVDAKNVDLTIENCTFLNNYAGCGGAISILNEKGISLTINNSDFYSNEALKGGAIFIDTSDCNFNIYNCNFNNNIAFEGGAIYTDTFKNGIVSGLYFYGNIARKGDGGAIYINKKNEVTFQYNYFIANHASGRGGAIYLDSKNSHLTLKNNLFCQGPRDITTTIGKNPIDAKSYTYDATYNTGDEDKSIVFNSGYFGDVDNNWWGNQNVNFEDGQLMEWKATVFKSNVKHSDNNPLKLDFWEITNGQKILFKIGFVQNDGNNTYIPHHSNAFSQFLTKNLGLLHIYNLDSLDRIEYAYKFNILESDKKGSFEFEKMEDDCVIFSFTPKENGLHNITANIGHCRFSKTININVDIDNYGDLINEIKDGEKNILKQKSYTLTKGLKLNPIEINKKGTIIDGNNTIIDLHNVNGQIFMINAENVLIKNIIFKNINANTNGCVAEFMKFGKVENCTFISNNANKGIIYFHKNGTVAHSNFNNNHATYGGCVFFQGYGNITHCNFMGNSAEIGGAIFFNDKGSISYTNSSNNTATKLKESDYYYCKIPNGVEVLPKEKEDISKINIEKIDINIVNKIIEIRISPIDVTGNITVKIESAIFTAKLINGSATIDLNNITPGQYNINITYNGDDKYKSNSTTINFNIPDINLIESSDMIKEYKNSKPFVVRIHSDNGGWVGAGVKITFDFNGIKYNRITNATGHAQLNINSPPGNYTITTSYNNHNQKNNIKIITQDINLIESNDMIKEYKNSKPFVVRIHSDNGGWVGAGVKITFDFNGIKYNRITNATGHAQLNINSPPGNYTITTSYNNHSQKNNIKINTPILNDKQLIIE